MLRAMHRTVSFVREPAVKLSQSSAKTYSGIETKLCRVQLSSLQSTAQDTKLVVQLRALRQVCKIRVCPLLFLQHGCETEKVPD